MMRSIKKGKTLNSYTVNMHSRLKRKQFSMNTMDFDRPKIVVQSIIQTLLQRATAQKELSQSYDQGWGLLLQNFKIADDEYYLVQDITDWQPKCYPDQQPYPEERKVIGKTKISSRLKRTATKRMQGSGEWQLMLEMDRKNSHLELNRREKQNFVQKMKRDCSVLRNSKYYSCSRPLGETRVFFKGVEETQVMDMRNNLQGEETERLRRISKLAKQQKWKASRLRTAFKKGKDLIDKIDPTDSIYLSEAQALLNRAYHKNSFSNMGLQSCQLEDSIIAKQTNFKEVANWMNLVRDMPNHKKSVIQKESEEERCYRLMNGLVDRGQEQLRLRVERSFHSSANTKLTQTTNRTKLHTSSSMSVGLFPSISNR